MKSKTPKVRRRSNVPRYSTTNSQCLGITNNGKQCKHKSISTTNYCYRHQYQSQPNTTKHTINYNAKKTQLKRVTINKTDEKESIYTFESENENIFIILIQYLIKFFQNIIISINNGFKNRPLLGACLFSGIKGIVADSFTQLIIQKSSFNTIDFHRTELFAFLGMLN